MRIRSPLLAVALAGLAVAAGCGDSGKKCPTESPQVNDLANCSAVANTSVTYHLRLCPTCNQTLSGCDVDLSQVGTTGQIFLNPLVEVCESASTCGGAGCATPSASGCTFTAPNAAPNTTYQVIAYDPLTNTQRSGTLTIVAGAPSCSF
jgi:hypothetical protein